MHMGISVIIEVARHTTSISPHSPCVSLQSPQHIEQRPLRTCVLVRIQCCLPTVAARDEYVVRRGAVSFTASLWAPSNQNAARPAVVASEIPCPR